MGFGLVFGFFVFLLEEVGEFLLLCVCTWSTLCFLECVFKNAFMQIIF